MTAALGVIAGVVFAFALISRRITPTVVSGPMLFVAAGLVLERLRIVETGLELGVVETIGEITLAVVLYSDATRMNTRELRRDLVMPARLLGIGLPLTIAFGTLVLALLLDGLSIWEAALIAAVLAPTDAALGQEVVTDSSVPARVRQTLTVESGLNDGLVVPAVALFIALSEGNGDEGIRFWLGFVLQQIGLAVVIGGLVGGAGAMLLTRAQTLGWVDGLYAQLATLGVGIIAFVASTGAGGNGFIAAFGAGLVFGSVASDAEHLGEYTEDTAQAAAIVSFFLFGNVLLGPALDNVTWQIVVVALLLLTVARMIPVAIATLGAGVAPPTVWFIGWFGPRGLASILFGLLLLDRPESSPELFAVVAWTVVFSVVLHGASAAAGARAYGRWYAGMRPEATPMGESEEVVMMPRPRLYGLPPKSGDPNR